VILGIVLVVLIYVIYQYMNNVSQDLSDYKSVNSSATIINTEDLSAPNSTRYAHGIWVYVKKHDGQAPFITFGDETNGGTQLYLAGATPTLKYKSGTDELIITDNFPIQKWVNLVVSVDNQIVDIYMDGKLVKSSNIAHPTPSSWGLSSGTFNGYITKFKRWAEPLNPQMVYDTYMKGNGRSGILPAYGIDMSIFKDNIEQSKFTLF